MVPIGVHAWSGHWQNLSGKPSAHTFLPLYRRHQWRISQVCRGPYIRCSPGRVHAIRSDASSCADLLVPQDGSPIYSPNSLFRQGQGAGKELAEHSLNDDTAKTESKDCGSQTWNDSGSTSGQDRLKWTLVGQIKLFCQASGKIQSVKCIQDGHPTARWTRCEWSLHGHLVLARWQDDNMMHGFSIIDPHISTQIFSSTGHIAEVYWADSPPSSSFRTILSALFRYYSTQGDTDGYRNDMVEFCSEGHGHWKATPLDLPWQVATRSSKGQGFDPRSMATGIQQRHGQRPHAYHISHGAGLRSWSLQQASIPGCWPEIYASVDFISATEGVCLVDATSDLLLGSWDSRGPQPS